MIATAIAVAFVVFSCKGKITIDDKKDFKSMPIQTVDSMFIVQTENGNLKMRVEADVMERYDNDTTAFELFPKGVAVYGYTEGGLMETMILADNAKHVKNKNSEREMWSAFGNVVVQNIIKRETMETDTIYWDRSKHEIYTDCYVRLYSSDGFMQGYGMRSDERARNSIIYKPFNSYGVVVQDSTAIIIDSVNFIGPFPKK